MIDLDVLRSVPLFADFEPTHLEELAKAVSTRQYAKHALLVREGEPGDAFFIVLRGSVAVVHIAADGRETILSLLKEHDFFGEMTVFDAAPRSASVKALTNVEVGVLSQRDILELIGRDAGIGRALVVKLAARLRAANAMIATSSQDVRSRIAGLLLDLSKNFGEPAENGTRIALRLTNQEMANMIGTTRETVNRTLNRFWDERLIDMRTAHIVVVDHEKLRTLRA
jgi:CRP/FNR family transcriptional regulator